MKKLLIVLVLVFIATAPFVSLAQENFVPLTNLPGIDEAASSETLPSFFNNLYKLSIGAAAVIAILQIMRAGTYFMFNKGSVAHNEQGKSLIMNAILGLLLVLSPAIVFGIINPDILNLKLDLGGLKPTPLEQIQVGEDTEALNGPSAPRECTTKYSQITAGGTQCRTENGFTSIPSNCCAGATAGGVCCGKPIMLDTNPSPDQKGTFTLNYVTEERDYDTADGKCLVRDTRVHTTLAACRTQLSTITAERDCGNTKCKVAVRHNCTESGNIVAFPTAAEFDRINDMPVCTE